MILPDAISPLQPAGRKNRSRLSGFTAGRQVTPLPGSSDPVTTLPTLAALTGEMRSARAGGRGGVEAGPAFPSRFPLSFSGNDVSARTLFPTREVGTGTTKDSPRCIAA